MRKPANIYNTDKEKVIFFRKELFIDKIQTYKNSKNKNH